MCWQAQQRASEAELALRSAERNEAEAKAALEGVVSARRQGPAALAKEAAEAAKCTASHALGTRARAKVRVEAAQAVAAAAASALVRPRLRLAHPAR